MLPGGDFKEDDRLRCAVFTRIRARISSPICAAIRSNSVESKLNIFVDVAAVENLFRTPARILASSLSICQLILFRVS